MSLIPRLFILLALCCALMACAAPSTTPAAIDEAAVSAPPMSSPLPPRLAKETVAIDTTCKTSAECAVKNVGNCCGAMPACVNKDSKVEDLTVDQLKQMFTGEITNWSEVGGDDGPIVLVGREAGSATRDAF